MKLWKQLSAAALAAAMLLSGCAGKQNDASAEDTTASTQAETTAATEAPQASVPDATAAEGDISPMLWKINGSKGNTLYLFGTIHVGDERNDTVLTYLQDELNSVDSLAVEFDIDAFEQDYTQQAQMAALLMYTDGTTAKDHIRADLYEKCVDYLTENNNYTATYDYLIAGYWMMLLEQTAIQSSPLSADNAMDSKLIAYAKEQGKEVLDVESPALQFNMIKDFSDALIEMEMESFFEDTDAVTEQLSDMYKVWLSGDEKTMTELEYGVDDEEYKQMTDEEKKLYEDYQNAMLIDRNTGMAAKAEEYLQSGKSVFLAVGAGHMVSDKGLVQLMKDKGYTVERVAVQQTG